MNKEFTYLKWNINMKWKKNWKREDAKILNNQQKVIQKMQKFSGNISINLLSHKLIKILKL